MEANLKNFSLKNYPLYGNYVSGFTYICVNWFDVACIATTQLAIAM